MKRKKSDTSRSSGRSSALSRPSPVQDDLMTDQITSDEEEWNEPPRRKQKRKHPRSVHETAHEEQRVDKTQEECFAEIKRCRALLRSSEEQDRETDRQIEKPSITL